MAAERTFFGQLGILIRPQTGPAQLAQLPLAELPLARAPVPEPLQLGQPVDRRPPAGVGRRHPRQCRLGATEGVEEPGLSVRVEQRLVLVLAVDVDQHPAELAELAGRRRPAVQARGAAAADLAAQDQLGLRLEAHLGQQRAGGRDVGDLEDALHQCPLGAVADLLGAGPGTEREGESIDHQGLAAAGLAGEEVQAGAEADVGAGDQREVTNPERLQHHDFQAVGAPGGRPSRSSAGAGGRTPPAPGSGRL